MKSFEKSVSSFGNKSTPKIRKDLQRLVKITNFEGYLDHKTSEEVYKSINEYILLTEDLEKTIIEDFGNLQSTLSESEEYIGSASRALESIVDSRIRIDDFKKRIFDRWLVVVFATITLFISLVYGSFIRSDFCTRAGQNSCDATEASEVSERLLPITEPVY
ncbi:hypothetical protein HK107_09030 [Parvularcula sp. ZS-1/3]|uniref:Uncharacterized protein n=1 Tax=Parvularcula mediterranea TaxID=2732508 RepID=A0A7Y3W5N3_9PROT|nr:hypothetical protein [Parvularcula mediterranea]NNU16461.1 hypothetical protein [Parvularcula mediterranea]